MGRGDEDLRSHHGRRRPSRSRLPALRAGPYLFTLADLATGEICILTNDGEHMGGRGLPTETILAAGVQVMIVGGLGSKAVAAFSASGVDVFLGAAGTVKDAIEDWQMQMLQRADMENACRDHRH